MEMEKLKLLIHELIKLSNESNFKIDDYEGYYKVDLGLKISKPPKILIPHTEQ